MVQDRVRIWESLFDRALKILDAAAAQGMPRGAWSFGGGTVLMRRHRHRVSRDVDICVPDPQLLGYLSPRLNAAAEALTGDYIEQGNFLKLYFAEGEIDFVVSGFLTADPFVIEPIAGRAVRVETSAEIIAKKLWHRGATFTARDLFDFALVAQREPEALRPLREILAAQRRVLLERLEGRDEPLREDFAALEALDFRPTFDECLDVIRSALARTPPHQAEQPRAGYRVARRTTPPLQAAFFS
jgi:hypothetical protein